MQYIDLTLQKPDSDEKITYLFSQIVSENKLSVILGSPGSGKTTLLENFSDPGLKVHYTTIRKFLKLTQVIDNEINLLLLDGLDEYRSTETDKAFVVKILAHELNELLKDNGIKCVISCREMDWYGETDRKALKDTLKIEPIIYKIQPLNDEQKYKLAKILEIINIQEFISKFDLLGFLENPQLFTMVAGVYKKDNSVVIKSKKSLMEDFIRQAGEEKNESYINNNINILEKDEIMKYAGYLAMYYIFSSVDDLENIRKEISSEENNYSREKLKNILNTNIFSENEFQHRTLAEFACAYYLTNYIEIPVERLKCLFTGSGDRIPTELRGTYAWLCSLTGDETLIAVDPYYQCVHGDNSHFDAETKKKIVTAVKNYSDKNPYFIDFRKQSGLEGFYEEALDEFLIREMKSSVDLKNHYRYFIANIISRGHNLSSTIKKYIEELLYESNENSHIKQNLIEVFKNSPEILKEILDNIISKKIEDPNDSLKDLIIYFLYPHTIRPDKISDYIFHYESNVIGHYYYLIDETRTDYNDKKGLIENIYEHFYTPDKSPPLSIPSNLQSFVDDYYLETILKYDEELSAKEIFDIIKYFRKYYHYYDGPNFYSYRFDLQNKLKEKDEKLNELTNELFNLYLDEYIKNISDDRLYDFSAFFNFRKPDCPVDIILNKINEDNEKKINTSLLYMALRTRPWAEQDQDKIHAIAEKCHLVNELDSWIRPVKSKWEIDYEEEKIKWAEEDRKRVEANTEYYKNKTDLDILNTFADLKFISDLIFMRETLREKYIKCEEFERLKNVLSSIIYNESSGFEYATLESLAKNSPEANRHIDRVYYSALALNDSIDNRKIQLEKILSEEFKKYLYIISVKSKHVVNIDHSNYDEIIENENSDFAKITLIEFMKKLVEQYTPEYQNDIVELLNKNIDIQSLKELIRIYKFSETPYYIENRIIDNILNVLNFKIDVTLLQKFLKNEKMSDEVKEKISAIIAVLTKNKKNFNRQMAVSLYGIFEEKHDRFESFKEDVKVTILDYMMNVFNTVESIEYVNGIQSPLNRCTSFLTVGELPLTDITSLNKLYKSHSLPDDIWRNRILNQIKNFKQTESDKNYSFYQIDEIKSLIFRKGILSNADFFADVCLRLEELKTKIEDKRINDLDPFYNHDNPKNENQCRDEIVRRLTGEHSNILLLQREQAEGNNSVDITIKYKSKPEFEIQVECKKDYNPTLYSAIKDQLIDKYFFSGVQFGIYLIFYFADKRNKDSKEEMLQKAEAGIPVEYKDKIRVICIDLRKEPV